jgi:hypothetical protein
LTVQLSPGDYLVAAHDDGGNTYEVFRRVPGAEERSHSIYRHLKWHVDNEGVVRLPRVGKPTFGPNGPPTTADYFRHGNLVARLQLIDVREFAAAQRIDDSEVAGTADGDALLFYDAAVDIAERMGMRLPTDSEFEALRAAGLRAKDGSPLWTCTTKTILAAKSESDLPQHFVSRTGDGRLKVLDRFSSAAGVLCVRPAAAN